MDWLNHNLFDWLGGVVGIASILANFVPKHTVVGKVVNFLAFNLRGLFGTPGTEQK